MKKQDVEFKVGEDTLRGTLFIPDGKGPFPAVIFFHGSGSNGAKFYEVGEKFPEKGIMAFAFNFRGCGESDGDFKEQTYGNALDDAQTAYEFLLTQNVDPSRIGVVGGSFGGFIAAMICLKLRIKALVLLGPSAHRESLSERIFKGDLSGEIKYFLDKNNWMTSESFENIASFRESLLIVKSGNDKIIPEEVPDKYFKDAINVSKKEIRTIKGADHRLTEQKWRDEFFDLILNWFLETL
jgi:esterase/lipase